MSKEYIDDEAIKRIEKIAQQEAIDNAKPSEALECVDDIYRNAVFVKKEVELKSFTTHHKLFGESPETSKTISEQCTTIKQALLKAQEQEKENAELKRVLSVIKEKSDLSALEMANDVNEFNEMTFHKKPYTQEEFELLKRYFK